MKKLTIICVMFGLLSVSAGSSRAAFIFFDDFNSENSGTGDGTDNYDSFANWSVESGTVDLLGGSYWGYLAPSSYGLFVDTDGSSGVPGSMKSDPLLLLPGEYVLGFDLAGNQRGAGSDMVGVGVIDGGGPLLSTTITLADDVPFTPYELSFNVPSTTSAWIAFAGLTGGDNAGLLLDNVSVSLVPATGSILLAGVGVALVGWLRRRRTL
jgi:hypothetical protein